MFVEVSHRQVAKCYTYYLASLYINPCYLSFPFQLPPLGNALYTSYSAPSSRLQRFLGTIPPTPRWRLAIAAYFAGDQLKQSGSSRRFIMTTSLAVSGPQKASVFINTMSRMTLISRKSAEADQLAVNWRRWL